MMKHLSAFLFILTLGVCFSEWSFAQSAEPEFQEGSVTLFEVSVPEELISEELSLRLKVFNLEFPLFREPQSGNKYYALVSPPLGIAAGQFTTMIISVPKESVKPDFPSPEAKKQQITVPKPYKYKNITVKTRTNVLTDEILHAPEFNVIPRDPKVVARIAKEDQEQKQILKMINGERYWQDEFILPVSQEITSQFGLFRIYSKHLRRRTHWGVDFKTPLGTPVKASSRGKVVLAQELYFPGKTIIIDHGMGLYTGYSHLDSLNVKIGEMVEQSQVIGRSGRSGKVTGLHLHWFAVNARVKFDPMTLLNIEIPKNGVASNEER